MANAKLEFIRTVKGLCVIACHITTGNSWDDNDNGLFSLKTEYTSEEYSNFLESLDFEYDEGYGSQNLHGTIWCTENIWFTRGEYDGSEWWKINQYPDIDDSLRNLDREREKEINRILED